jgi:aminomethyltransferase
MKKTLLCERHLALGARMTDFAGWQMPIQYPKGIVAEHLATRNGAGLFDVSHMGRFSVRGTGAIPFLQHLLTNNAQALAPGQSHYTILANSSGGAIDDAYLYQLADADYLLVVNASNAQKDYDYLTSHVPSFKGIELTNQSDSLAMIALQGPQSENILSSIIKSGSLPAPKRNALSQATLLDAKSIIARTGYTGEPLCFELFIPAEAVEKIWDALIAQGAEPIGLGARDTLRLEAGLPLYGHEFGISPDGTEIPILACPVARYAVSFDKAKGDFCGATALKKQADALKRYAAGDFSSTTALPRVIRPFRLRDNGIARAETAVYYNNAPVGYVTSGTMAPYWIPTNQQGQQHPTDQRGQRAVGLAMVQPDVPVDAVLEMDVRGRRLKAQLVGRNLENRKNNFATAVL